MAVVGPAPPVLGLDLLAWGNPCLATPSGTLWIPTQLECTALLGCLQPHGGSPISGWGIPLPVPLLSGKQEDIEGDLPGVGLGLSQVKFRLPHCFSMASGYVVRTHQR